MTTGQEGRASVAMVTDAIYPYHRGGKELRYHELGYRLADRADVHIYTMKWWHGPKHQTQAGITLHALGRHRPLYAGGRRSLAQAICFAFACFRLLGHRFDVLEADHMPYLQIPVLRLVAILKRTPLVVTWHEVWGRRYWCEYLGFAGNAAWLVERLAMWLPDSIIAASPQTARRLRPYVRPRTRVFVAPNGVDVDVARSTWAAGEPVDVVTVGRLMPHKRVDMLLRSIALLCAQGSPVTCRIIGDGPERDALHDLAETLGVADQIEFRHDVGDQKELYGLLKSATVFAFPSAREGFGIAVLEAIACGLPVVTTSAPDNVAQDLVGQSATGVVCAPSSEALAEAIRQVLSVPRSQGADKGLDSWLSEYTWDAAADQVAIALSI